MTGSCEYMPRHPPNRRQPDGSVLSPAYGTEPPIPKPCKCPWYGKTVEDRAKWLQAAPDDVASDKRQFAAMNEFSKEDDTVLLCRRIPIDGDPKWIIFPLRQYMSPCYYIPEMETSWRSRSATTSEAWKLRRSQIEAKVAHTRRTGCLSVRSKKSR